MGITGLIPFLEKSSKKTNISQFSGKTAAIDTYCWLHKGAFSCADKLLMGQSTDAYVKYCMKFVNMLIATKLKPILVFDGRHLPAKAETEVKRREARNNNRKRAIELIKMGNTTEGRNMLKRSLDVTHRMALEVIKECQKLNIDCIVAPYEADAQLAYLNLSSIADIVITEDSDLVLFGCKKIFFKMDLNGNGILVEQDRLHLAMGIQAENFNMDKFRNMCILSGCDYLPSLPGIGLAKACKFMCKIPDLDIQRALPRLSSYLNMKSLTVTKEYIEAFLCACVTFKHQLVYCPLTRKQVRLQPVTADVTEEQLKFAGDEIADDKIAWQLALGNYDPFTLEQLHDFDPDNVHNCIGGINSWSHQPVIKHVSIWSKSFQTQQIHDPEKENIINLPDTIGKISLLETNSVKEHFIITKKRTYEEFQELSDVEILQLYKDNDKYNENKIAEGNNDNDNEKCYSSVKSLTSPILSSRKRNPFKKQANEDSPSLLNKGKKRCLIRFKPTVIDDSAVTESKFFSKTRKLFHEKENSKKTDYCSHEKLCDDTEVLIENTENIQYNKDVEKEEIKNHVTDSIFDIASAEKKNDLHNSNTDTHINTSYLQTHTVPNVNITNSSCHFIKNSNNTESDNNCSKRTLNNSITYKEVELQNSDEESRNNASPVSDIESCYVSTDEITSKTTLFQQWQYAHCKSNINRVISKEEAKIQNNQLSSTRQTSVRSNQSKKKSNLIPGQSLLNRFGFQKKVKTEENYTVAPFNCYTP